MGVVCRTQNTQKGINTVGRIYARLELLSLRLDIKRELVPRQVRKRNEWLRADNTIIPHEVKDPSSLLSMRVGLVWLQLEKTEELDYPLWRTTKRKQQVNERILWQGPKYVQTAFIFSKENGQFSVILRLRNETDLKGWPKICSKRKGAWGCWVVVGTAAMALQPEATCRAKG